MLIWDQNESHKTPLITSHLTSLDHIMLLLPARANSYLQPLDVSINKPFKSSMIDKLSDLFDTVDELTSNRNLKRESYGAVNLVHVASQKITSEIIKNSFLVCGLCFPRDILLLNDLLSKELGNNAKNIRYIEDLDWDRDDEELRLEIKNQHEIEIIDYVNALNL